jgi:hypothetical protein
VWETDSIQGSKSIKAYFMDEAKNTTKVPAEATIILKTNPPQTALIIIDQGRKYTTIRTDWSISQLQAKTIPLA